MAVEISGLREEEAMEKESIREEAEKFLEKIKRPLAHLQIHVKSSHHGNAKKEYHVHAKLALEGGQMLTCSTPESRQHRENWDLHMGLKEVLDELRGMYEKHGKRHHQTERPEEV